MSVVSLSFFVAGAALLIFGFQKNSRALLSTAAFLWLCSGAWGEFSHGFKEGLGINAPAAAAPAAGQPGSAKATAATSGTPSPTMTGMMKWKTDFLSKYDEVIYLDSDSRQVSEDVFFARVVDEKRGFNVRIDSGAPKRINLRLLSDAEQRPATPGVK